MHCDAKINVLFAQDKDLTHGCIMCAYVYTHQLLNLFYMKIHVKLPQVFTILREYSRNVRSAKFHI